jgi:hypothetical protein
MEFTAVEVISRLGQIFLAKICRLTSKHTGANFSGENLKTHKANRLGQNFSNEKFDLNQKKQKYQIMVIKLGQIFLRKIWLLKPGQSLLF